MKIAEFLRNHRIRILLCVQFLLILVGVAGLFGPEGVIIGTEETERLLTGGVPLAPGVYTARLSYEVEKDASASFTVTAQETFFKGLICNGVALYRGAGERECRFYLTQHVDNLRVDVQDDGDSGLRILGAEIERGTEGSRLYLFWLLLFCVCLDSALFVIMYQRKQPIPLDRQIAIFGIPALTLLSSIPVMVDYNVGGADLIYHMMRIEDLAERILAGETGAGISSVWLAGHGYAGGIFYGDTFLILPALLRILGFGPSSAYRLFLAAVNLATAVISYVCFRRCFHNRYIGMFGCTLYMLQPYRLYNLYNRGAVGEYTAMIFLPLLAWGFCKIYTEDPGRKGYLWNCVILVAGFSGIIQSHVLSCEMTGIFVGLLCLILWKKTFRCRTFCVLVLTVVLTVLVNARFLVPFLDLMTADSYYFGHNANAMIQYKGVYPAHLLYTLQAAGGTSDFVEFGMMNTEPIGIGMALLLCLSLWIFLRIRHRGGSLSGNQMAERRTGDIALGLGCTALFMSTCCFPWDFLSSLGRLFATVNGMIQFPTRFTMIAGICIVMTGCVAGTWILASQESGERKAVVLAGIALVAVVFASYQLNDTLLTRGAYRIYSTQAMGHSPIMGAEYLPEGALLEHMTYHEPVLSEGVSMTGYTKDGLKAEGYVESKSEGYIEFPMLYYKGYEARAMDSGECFSVCKGENADVRVLLPEGFSGKLQVKYAGMWYWKVGEAVSILSTAGICILYGMKKGKGACP